MNTRYSLAFASRGIPMYKSPYFALGTLLCCLTSAPAQVHSYRHHSTLEGDVLAGLGELAIGTGFLVEKTALAEEAHVRALRDRVAVQRQWIDIQYQLDHLQDSRRQRKLAAAQARADFRQKLTRVGAEQLVRDVIAGIDVWSGMVQDAAYQSCVDQVVQVLNRASAGYDLSDESDRLELRRIAREMKTLIQANPAGVSSYQRSMAIQRVRELRYLASDQADRDVLPSQL